MRIQEEMLDSMFVQSGVSKARLHEALRTMGPKHLHTAEMRRRWTWDNPTTCYCYVVSEMLYWYVAPDGTKPFKLVVPEDPGLHRFLRWPDGNVVDLTADQFPNYECVDYGKAKVSYFLQVKSQGPSKRALMLASLLGYETFRKPNKFDDHNLPHVR